VDNGGGETELFFDRRIMNDTYESFKERQAVVHSPILNLGMCCPWKLVWRRMTVSRAHSENSSYFQLIAYIPGRHGTD
jgi:hypothetical protein